VAWDQPRLHLSSAGRGCLSHPCCKIEAGNEDPLIGKLIEAVAKQAFERSGGDDEKAKLIMKDIARQHPRGVMIEEELVLRYVDAILHEVSAEAGPHSRPQLHKWKPPI